MTRVSTEEDVLNLQRDLESVYSWAQTNHMRWNQDKFQVLRLGPNRDLKESTTIFNPEYAEVVEEKDVIKDLGLMIDSTLSYEHQLAKAVSKTNQKAGWVLRTFSTRNVELWRTMWRSLIQRHLDYGCLLWAPYGCKGKLRKMNSYLTLLCVAM